jgi:hypothetical protein
VDRRTLALGVAAVVALAAAVGVTVVNRQEQDPVAAYIERVNAVEDGMAGQLSVSAVAYREFARTGVITAARGRKLARAEATLRALDRRLAAVPAPDRAQALRRLLSKLGDAHVAIAEEVTGIAAFTPAFVRIGQRSAAAAARLQRALQTKDPQAQAAALDAYGATLAQLQLQLRALDAPSVFEPARSTQLRAFAGTRRAGDALAAELRKPKRTQVAALSRRFAVAARSAGAVPAQQAQNAAIRAYNARIHTIATLRADIAEELARVQKDS